MSPLRRVPHASFDDRPHLEELAALGIDHVILIGPTFEWGDDLDAILSVVDDIHALAV